MAGLKVKCDCFAYMKYEKSCHALRELYCMDAECPFYKTAKQRCDECRKLRKKGVVLMSCAECIERGIKKQEV
jgi:hypothetical protein